MMDPQNHALLDASEQSTWMIWGTILRNPHIYPHLKPETQHEKSPRLTETIALKSVNLCGTDCINVLFLTNPRILDQFKKIVHTFRSHVFHSKTLSVDFSSAHSNDGTFWGRSSIKMPGNFGKFGPG